MKLQPVPVYRATRAELKNLGELYIKILNLGLGLCFGLVKIVCEDDDWKIPLANSAKDVQNNLEDMLKVKAMEAEKEVNKKEKKKAMKSSSGPQTCMIDVRSI